MPVPPARRKKVMSMFPDQLDRAVQQDQPVSAIIFYYVHNSSCKYMHVYKIMTLSVILELLIFISFCKRNVHIHASPPFSSSFRQLLCGSAFCTGLDTYIGVPEKMLRFGVQTGLPDSKQDLV